MAPVRFSVLLDDCVAWISCWMDAPGQTEQCYCKVRRAAANNQPVNHGGICPIWGPRLSLGPQGSAPLFNANSSGPRYPSQVAGVSSLRLVVETEFSGGARAVWLDPHMLLVGSGWI